MTTDPKQSDDSSPARKPRWTSEQRRSAGGIEKRAEYRGHREDRRFGVGVLNAPAERASTTANSTAATVTGTPIVYSVPYTVSDRFGTFTEVVAPGAVSAILPTTDTRFLVEHSGLALARVSSGTLTLTDSPQSLTCRATLDPRSPTASEVIIAVGRGVVNQMSIGMIVVADEWTSDMSHRTITRIGELLDVSVVSFPASPTTSVELLDAPEEFQPDLAGPDGTLGRPFGAASSQDGTGSRGAAVTTELRLELDLVEARRHRSGTVSPLRPGSHSRLERDLLEFRHRTTGRQRTATSR